ncbi:MAG: glycosyltransferase family 2 protein [Chloroflexota bacterium]|nr:MAG: glycosyltransferase family 2 protein [Chloroflexota bacterium]
MVTHVATLTVVVVNYNTRALLDRCLNTVMLSAREFGPDTDIWVVDNASRDGSVEMVREKYPTVRVVASAVNRGFGGGANLVIRLTRSLYVLIMNPDTEAIADAPAALVRFAKENPRAGIVGGRLSYPDGRFQHSCFRFPDLAMSVIDTFPLSGRLVESPMNGRYPRRWYRYPFEVDHPLGAVMLARRSCLDRIGGFDESFFMYSEEIDLSWRARAAGFQVWYTPTAAFAHHSGAATAQFRGPMRVALRRSRGQFFDKHYGQSFRVADRMIAAVGLVRGVIRDVRDVRNGCLTAAEFAERRDAYRWLARL